MKIKLENLSKGLQILAIIIEGSRTVPYTFPLSINQYVLSLITCKACRVLSHTS